MDAAIMGMIGVIIPMVESISGLVLKIHKTIQKMDRRLTKIELMLKETGR